MLNGSTEPTTATVVPRGTNCYGDELTLWWILGGVFILMLLLSGTLAMFAEGYVNMFKKLVAAKVSTAEEDREALIDQHSTEGLDKSNKLKVKSKNW